MWPEACKKTHLFIVRGLQYCETLHCACLLMGFPWAQLGACLWWFLLESHGKCRNNLCKGSGVLSMQLFILNSLLLPPPLSPWSKAGMMQAGLTMPRTTPVPCDVSLTSSIQWGEAWGRVGRTMYNCSHEVIKCATNIIVSSYAWNLLGLNSIWNMS